MQRSQARDESASFAMKNDIPYSARKMNFCQKIANAYLYKQCIVPCNHHGSHVMQVKKYLVGLGTSGLFSSGAKYQTVGDLLVFLVLMKHSDETGVSALSGCTAVLSRMHGDAYA